MSEIPGSDLEKPLWRRLTSEAGSGLIELALVLPIFLLFVFGFINFMLVMFGLCNITYAVRAAARYGCLHSNTSMAPAATTDFTNILNPYFFSYPSNTHSMTLFYTGDGTNTVGNQVYVKVTLTYNLVLPGYTYNGLQVSANSAGLVIQ